MSRACLCQVERLLYRGADQSVLNKDQRSVLDVASEFGHSAVSIRILYLLIRPTLSISTVLQHWRFKRKSFGLFSACAEAYLEMWKIVLCEYSKFRIEQLLQYSIRFETSTIIRNFRMLTVTNFLLI